MEKILSKNKKEILLGNEAIVRGALEAGVEYATTYPGTPASEIGDTFYKIQNPKFKVQSLYFEYATNEKVALESAMGANFSGRKTLVSMKHFGLNVASDTFIPLVYVDVFKGMVIVVGDDPSCHSSVQSEQDSRGYSYLAHIPTLEPSDPQECKDFTKLAFKISEKYKIPVLIRITTRVAHQRMPVYLEKISASSGLSFQSKALKTKGRFSSMPPSRTLEMHSCLLKKISEIQKEVEASEINLYPSFNKKADLGIITSGISYLYVMEAQRVLNIKLPVFKLGWFYPLPYKKLKNFIKNCKKVLVVEELEPYLEKEIKLISSNLSCIFGKSHLPEVGELTPEYVTLAISKILNIKSPIGYKNINLKFFSKRTPKFCQGCPYWLTLKALKDVAPEDTIWGGDIGCYMMAYFPPFEMQDYLFCMGSSIGISHGISKNIKLNKKKQKVIALIGDSTFFHAGIPGLINCVENKSNPLIIIMDNRITAMTGHQPRPGLHGKPNIEDLVKACGVKYIKVIDPINQEELRNTIKEFLEKKEVSVIIARRPCAFVKSH